MIEGYLDESGIQDGAPVCVIAGYAGGPGQFRKLDTEWKRALDRAGVPLERFHALNLIQHRGFFFNMPRGTHQQLIDDLTTAIIGQRVWPIAFGVILADFDALTLPQKQFFTGGTLDAGKLITSGNPKKPYFMPFLQCVKRVASYGPVGGKANFYFGLDRPFFNYAQEMFKMIKADPAKPHSSRIGKATQLEAKKTSPLQAADFLTYLTYRHMIERNAANDWSVWPTHPLGTLMKQRRTAEDSLYYNCETMEENLQQTYVIAGNWDGH